MPEPKVEMEREVEEEFVEVEKEDDWKDRSWIDNEEMKDDLGHLIFDTVQKESLPEEEVDFFSWLVREKLYPLEETAESRKEKTAALASLRDKVCFSVYLLNLLWLVFIVVLQSNKAAQFDVVMFNITAQMENRVLAELGFRDGIWKFDAINTVMMLMFGTLVVLQFVAMLAVKWDSLKRLMARTNIPFQEMLH